MSTNATIIVQTANGVKAIYLHWDGDDRSAGKTLREHYNSQEKAEQLMKLGGLSVLAPSPEKPEGHTFEKAVRGYCIAYGRDRRESGMAAKKFNTKEKAIDSLGNCWNYFWDGTSWETIRK